MKKLRFAVKNKFKFVFRNNGVSLVEVLMALVILLLVFVGLMQAAILSIDSNMKNVLRDEAVALASATMEDTRTNKFDDIKSDTSSIPSGSDCPSSITTGTKVQMGIRNMTKDMCVRLIVSDIDADTKQLNITVGWRWNEEDYTHNVSTLRRRNE